MLIFLHSVCLKLWLESQMFGYATTSVSGLRRLQRSHLVQNKRKYSPRKRNRLSEGKILNRFSLSDVFSKLYKWFTSTKAQLISHAHLYSLLQSCTLLRPAHTFTAVRSLYLKRCLASLLINELQTHTEKPFCWSPLQIHLLTISSGTPVTSSSYCVL